MININIKDGTGSNKRAKVIDGSGGNGLVVYPFNGASHVIEYPEFSNSTFGSELNIDGSATGTPDNIHNGTDNAYWTASTLVGDGSDFVFNSTDQAVDGTRSISTLAAEGGDTILFTRASTIDLSTYSSITGSIYINDWDTRGTKDVRFQFRNSGVTTGVQVDISNYISTGTLGVWQAFSIPLTDFSLGSTISDELTFEMVDTGPGTAPGVYFDILKLQEAAGGGNEEFKIQPPRGEEWSVDEMYISLADALPGTVADGTMPGLGYDKILGISSLANGITFQIRSNGEIVYSKSVSGLLDLIELPGLTSLINGSDGTNTFVKIEKTFDTPIFLDGTKDDRISFFINDNLTGLLRFRSSALVSVVSSED